MRLFFQVPGTSFAKEQKLRSMTDFYIKWRLSLLRGFVGALKFVTPGYGDIDVGDGSSRQNVLLTS